VDYATATALSSAHFAIGRAGEILRAMTLPSALKALKRPSAIAEVGGFRPPEDPLSSWMGAVKVAAR